MGAVASGHPEVSAAASDTLRAGGNAFDAVTAAAFASTVAEPLLTSLGGGGFCLARTATGEEVLFDFFVDVPGVGRPDEAPPPELVPVTVRFVATDQVFHAGTGSVAVPGTLAGLVHVHGRLGRLDLGAVVAPAVRLAAEGVELNEYQHHVAELLRPILLLTPEGRARWEHALTGDRMAEPELAAFLEAVPAGAVDRFYRGDVAARMVADVEALTVDDLARYAVHEREPLTFEYRGHRVLTNPQPSVGGSLVRLGLSVLEQHRLGGPWGSPSHVAALAASMVEVEHRRARGGTTHVSVTDDEGNVAALSMSNGEGSGYVVPGTGVMLNNMMGEDDLHPEGVEAARAGARVGSMMAPSVVLDHDGGPPLVLGSGGSARIRTALLQVISNVCDFRLPLADAIDAPRIHWDGSHLQVEDGLPEETVDRLRHRFSVNLWSDRNFYFGGVHGVRGEHTHGDGRRGGHSLLV